MLNDLRYGLRQTRRHPAVAIVVIVTIGLAVGADATIFSAINALLLRPLAVPHPDRLVRVVAARSEELTWSNFETLRDATDRVALVAFTTFRGPVREPRTGRIESLAGERVSEHYFEVLTGAPLQGVLISEPLRERWFPDGDAIGKPLKVNGVVYTVAGVAPARYVGTNFAAPTDIWLPLEKGERDHVRVIGRLAPGATMKDAGERLDVAVRSASPALDGVRIGPERAMLINPSSPRLVGAAMTIALLLGALSVLVAAANIVSVLIARVVLRRRELLIRMSVGARRNALVRQLVTESAPLALPAALLAWIVARLGSRVYTLFLPPQTIPAIDFMPDLRVALFAFGLSLLVVVTATLGAALHATSTLERTVRASRSPRLLPAIVIGQLALAVVVLVTAALLVRTAQDHASVQPGFETAHQLVVQVDPDRATDMAWHIRQLPAIASVVIARNAPLGRQLHATVRVSAQPLEVQWTLIDRGYFDVLGIAMVRGRDFTSNERNHVAIINETMARALGKESVLRIDGRPEPFTVVGVVRDAHYSALAEPSAPYVYLPLSQGPLTAAVLLVKTTGDSRQDIATLMTSQGVAPSVFPLSDSVKADLWLSLTASVVAGALGLLAALLAGVGLFGVVSMSVQSRGRELAVRSALGATPASLGALVARGSSRLLLLGLGAGLLLAAPLARSLGAVPFGITPFDPKSWFGTVAVITIAVVAATAVPLFRAMTPLPISLLREE